MNYKNKIRTFQSETRPKLFFTRQVIYSAPVSEFAKNSDEIVEVTDENICAGFSACPEGDQMPMTAAYFNGAYKWVCDKIQALQDCFDQLTIENMGTGLGLFIGRVDKVFRLRSILAGKGVTIDQTANELTINSTATCCYSEAGVPAGPPPAGFIASLLVDDCTNPSAPFAYIWSCKDMAYYPLVSGTSNMPPECSVHPAQTATIGTAFSYDASGTDADGDTLTYAQTGTWPAGFAIDAATGEITAPAGFTAPAGMYVLNWTIDDGNNAPVDCMISLTIEATSNVKQTASITAACADVGIPFEPNIHCGVGDQGVSPLSNTTTEQINGWTIRAFGSGEGGPGARGTIIIVEAPGGVAPGDIVWFEVKRDAAGTSTGQIMASSADNFQNIGGNLYQWSWNLDVFGLGGGSLASFSICYECA